MSDPIRPTDDHPEGGRYVDSQGHFINANGEYIDDAGKVSKTPVKAPAPKPAAPAQPIKPAER